MRVDCHNGLAENDNFRHKVFFVMLPSGRRSLGEMTAKHSLDLSLTMLKHHDSLGRIAGHANRISSARVQTQPGLSVCGMS